MGATHVAEIVELDTEAVNDVGTPGRSGTVAVANDVAVEAPMLFKARIVKSYFPPLVNPVITIDVADAVGVSGATPAAVIE
jgi:hypothetical protein